jgi:hypothetical protein
MRAASPTLQQLATHVGTGDHAAFRRLYATCAPQVLTDVGSALADPAHSMHVVRATFCEVWWMCAFDVRCGAPPQDIPTWIAAIAHRRSGERRYALDLIHELRSAGQASFWAGLLADHDQWTRFELATMLDGHDHIEPFPVLTQTQAPISPQIPGQTSSAAQTGR